MPRLVVLAGPPAVGKSTIARELAARTGAFWLRIDSMDQAIWNSGTAPRDLRDWTYRAAQAVAADNLALGRDVVADCVNGWPQARLGWERAAQRGGGEVMWIAITCSDLAEHRHRVETRRSDIPGFTPPTWSEVSALDFQPPDQAHLRIDTAGLAVADAVRMAVAAFEAG